MATRPTVSPVKGTDLPNMLRSLNNALSLIRDEIWAVSQVASNAASIAGQNAFNSGNDSVSISQLQQQIAAMQAILNTLAQSGAGPLATYRADASINSGDVVFPTSDGGVTAVDTQDPTQIFAAIGIATSNAAINGQVTVRRSGVFTGAGAGWEAGRAIYAEVGGGLTMVPNYAAVAIQVGVAITATDLEVRTAWPALRDRPLYEGGFDDFLPVTWQLVRSVVALLESLNGQPDGFVVKTGDVLTTRVLIAGSGSGITISNEDGSGGDPAFALG